VTGGGNIMRTVKLEPLGGNEFNSDLKILNIFVFLRASR